MPRLTEERLVNSVTLRWRKSVAAGNNAESRIVIGYEKPICEKCFTIHFCI